MKNGRDSGFIYWKLNYRKNFIIYVELKNPTKFTMAINKERVFIRVWIVERLALWGCLTQ
ncbi:hypothetical protein [Sporosarcina sp. FSL K6-5500]|uniref:hypothetical protein n=1 Tax=Sporosarcina sp. FSL K6-5500 TaxID=2921558 RepID=UPI0030F69981